MRDIESIHVLNIYIQQIEFLHSLHKSISRFDFKRLANPEEFRLDPPVDDVSPCIVFGWQQSGTQHPPCVWFGKISIPRTDSGSGYRS